MDQRQDIVGTYGWADHYARLYETRGDAGADLAEHLLSLARLAVETGELPDTYPFGL